MNIATGFKSERTAVVPQPFMELMSDNPLTGDLYVSATGYISNALHHYIASDGLSGEYLLLFCTSGKGSVKTGGHNYAIGQNDYMVADANSPYTATADREQPWTIYWVTFKGAKAPLLSASMWQPSTVTAHSHGSTEQRIELFESILSIVGGAITLDRLNYANILLLNLLASFAYIDKLTDALPESGNAAQTMVNRTTRYMSENIDKQLSLAQLSAQAGYSKSYLHRNFVKELGYSPIDYFIRIKINKASIYLIKTSMTTAQIAEKLGFGSPEYFSRTFRNTVGLSPSQFRKQGFKL